MNPKKDESYYANAPMPDKTQSKAWEEPWRSTVVVGKPEPRVDAYDRLSGAAVYPSDVSLPGMLYGAILRCPHPNARVKSLDPRPAQKMKGVAAVIHGATPSCDVEWPYDGDVSSKLFDSHCRFEGETVAAVAASTPSEAWDAVRAIRVEYEVLPYLVNETEALKPDAVLVHDKGNTVKTESYSRGDIAKGFDEADVVLEENYRTECEIQVPMELHGCVASWDGSNLTVWESTQGVYAVQSRVAEVLKMPLSRVRVIGHYMGGGFGSKLQPGKYTIIAALLAKAAARPVKLFLTREETFLATGNRPPSDMRLKAGIKKDGTITALDFSVTGTGGAYQAGGISLVDWLIRDLYVCSNVRTEAVDVYINAGPARPFRAPGHPQGSWALEQMIDALAEAVGMDPLDLRLKNIPSHSQAREGNPPYTSDGLRECLMKGAEAFRWKESRERTAKQDKNSPIRRGVGMAGASWFVGNGRPPSTVIVKLFPDGSANLNMGASDIGTGTKTIMAMIVAEELGVPLGNIQVENADTGTTQYATPSGGSKTVPTESPATRNAAEQVKRQLMRMAAKELRADPERLSLTNGEVVSSDDPSRKVKVTDLSELKKQGVIVGVGYRHPNPEGKVSIPFAAQFCEVEIDTFTGEMKILRFVGAHESGRVMNRLTFDNQVFGGITMGIGFAATEVRVLDRNQTGKMVNRNWHDYKLPTALDVPLDIVSVAVDVPDTEANASGAKGLGEPVTVPTGAAVANAVYNALGVRLTSTPINPLAINRVLGGK